MNETEVTKEGLRNDRPDREATTGVVAGKKGRHDELMVEPARFQSYYGLPVINKPVWSSPDIPGYLFLGGLAGASSLLGAGAQATSRHSLAKVSKTAAAGAGLISIAALVHDLGRPTRFLNMLRVFKPSSPMSVGSWVLSAYVPAALVAAGCELTGSAPLLGSLATVGAASLGPAVASYTAALVADTAVPAWHEGHRTMPFLFVSSAAAAAGGVGMLAAAVRDNAPAVRLGAFGGLAELVLTRVMEREMHPDVRRHYRTGRAHGLMRSAELLTAAGVAASSIGGRRSRLLAAAAGACLLAGSACTRFGIFFAGMGSAGDPAATITPQRERAELARSAEGDGASPAAPRRRRRVTSLSSAKAPLSPRGEKGAGE